MENAVDALKMAFAVIVFVMALSISINMFSSARETADVVLHSSDKTEYMEFQEVVEGTESRIVGLETIIPTLYKYYKENYTVIFRNQNEEYMQIYETKTESKLWSEAYKKDSYNNGTKICAFDVDDETKRHEPWTGSHEEYRKNISAFLSGGKYTNPSGNTTYDYDYSNWGFISKYNNKKFKENIGEYIYNNSNEEDMKKKRVIIYTLQ